MCPSHFHVCYSNRLLNVELLRRRCWMLESELSINGITRKGMGRSTGRKPCPTATISRANPTWIVLRLRPGLRGNLYLMKIIKYMSMRWVTM